MPTLAELRNQAAELSAQIEAERSDTPVDRLRRVNESLARYDILWVRHGGGLELLNRISEGTVGGQREVLGELCRTWWDAVLRETRAAAGEVPEAMAAYGFDLPLDATDDQMRDFVAVRLLELERLLS